MIEPTELLPCPFCGGINIIHCSHHMYCHACGADGPDADGQHESEAIAAWNTRTPQPTQAQVGAVPLTPKQVAEIADAAHREYDRLVGSGQCAPRWSAVFAHLLERAHGIGIKGGQHG